MVRDHIRMGPLETEMRRFFIAAVALGAWGGPALAADPIGDWLVEDKAAVIRIEPCGPAFCGIIAWTRDTPGLDDKNPDPSKRARSVLGVEILIGMKPDGERWSGEVYNPENGKTYTSHMALKSPDSLRMEGCVLGFLCGGETWTRVKCDDSPASAPKSSGKGPGSAAKGAARKLPISCHVAVP